MSFGHMKQFAIHLIASIRKDNIMTISAVIAFFGFSSMIPLALLLLYGASLFIPHTPVEPFLADVLKSYIPTIPDAAVYLNQNVERLATFGPKIGVFGLLGLIWTSVSGFVSFQQILDMIWEIRRQRSFVIQYFVGFGMLLILLSLTVAASLATEISPVLVRNIFMASPPYMWLVFLHDIAHVSFPLLLFITCYVCYRFLPSRTLRNSYLLIGAAAATVCIYVSRMIFVWYTGHLGQYELIYGSLTFVMLFIFWVYIVSTIVLLGAEVAVTLQEVNEPYEKQTTN